MPDKPFFIYYAPGATHAPHHAPKEWSDKYKGKFDQGWDKLREETFALQKKLGVIPQDCQLTPRPPEIPAWDTISDEMKPILARQMEVYAGFLEHTDHHVGRLIETLKDMAFSADETCDVGREYGSPVTNDYKTRKFNGEVYWVEIDLSKDTKDADHLIKPEERLRVAMATH